MSCTSRPLGMIGSAFHERPLEADTANTDENAASKPTNARTHASPYYSGTTATLQREAEL